MILRSNMYRSWTGFNPGAADHSAYFVQSDLTKFSSAGHDSVDRFVNK